MDPRRFLILAACGPVLCGCAILHGAAGPSLAPVVVPVGDMPAQMEGNVEPATGPVDLPDDPEVQASAEPAPTPRPYEAVTTAPATVSRRTSAVSGREAIAAANTAARAPSRPDNFVGGVQVFVWSPGRVFEVWTAPLRVTTLTLSPGEAVLSKAAGDTVRWQIGEATSGSGLSVRTHLMIKPLERGLETNLILTTNRRVYLIDLKSGGTDAFNAAVAWEADALLVDAPLAAEVVRAVDVRVPDPVAMPTGPLDGRYRIEPQGRRIRWTPTAVSNDGLRTFITFDPEVLVDEAPVLFVIAADGETHMVNYRQAGGLLVVDRVFDRAELRLGDRRPQVVRIRRLSGGPS